MDGSERGVKESIDVKLGKPSPNRGGGLHHHLSAAYKPTVILLPQHFSTTPTGPGNITSPGEVTWSRLTLHTSYGGRYM